MDSLITIFLPLALAVIMFSLGLGLTIQDFTRIALQPKAFAVGALAQLVGIPVVGFIVASSFGLPPELAVGVMILSLCPGGVTSNLLTKLARGDVALAISVTAVSSLVAVLSMPPLVVLFARHFMGLDAPSVDVTSLGIAMFMITAAPVIVGILVRHFAERFALTLEPVLDKVAVALFVIVVIGALAANWSLFVENFAALAPGLVVLNIALLALGLLLARLFSLSGRQSSAIAIEAGVQNATLGITVGSLLVEQAASLPAFSLPSGVYGITMYLVTIPFVLWRRRTAV